MCQDQFSSGVASFEATALAFAWRLVKIRAIVRAPFFRLCCICGCEQIPGSVLIPRAMLSVQYARITEKPEMAHSFQSYLRKAEVGAAVPNVVINPLLSWLLNQHHQVVPLLGTGGIAFDTGITALVLSLLVTFFIAPATRRDLAAGRVPSPLARPCDRDWPRLLPTREWALGLAPGGASAALLVPLTLWLCGLTGLSSLPLPLFALAKAIYTPILAAFVARCIIWRLQEAAPPAPAHAADITRSSLTQQGENHAH